MTDTRSLSIADEPVTDTSVRRGLSMVSVIRFVMPVVVVMGIFAVLTNHARNPLSNTDTYFHLRFGHEFLHGNWSLRDPGSVTSFGTNEWVPTQWLPQVVMAQAEDWWGLAGVAWLAGLMYIGLALTLWTIARTYANPLAAAPVTVVAILAAAPGVSMRPQVLSFILVAVTTAAWLRTRSDGKPRWWLILVAWVWPMCHGMWTIGLIIGVVALVGIALDRAVPRRQLLRLTLIPLASAVAAALTPVGPAVYSAVLKVNSRGGYFAEWQPPDFTKPNCIALLILIGVVLLRWSRSRTQVSWTEVLLVGLAIGWALYAVRTVPVAAMMITPFAAMALQNALGDYDRPSRKETLSILTGAAACLAVLAVLVPRTADEPPKDPSWYASLDSLPDDTAVLNDWGEGGYLMWRFPDLDFVVNGYGDIYTDAEIERNYKMDTTLPGWDDAVRDTGATYALLRPRSRLAYNLEHLENWSVRERSSDIMLLVAPDDWPDPQN